WHLWILAVDFAGARQKDGFVPRISKSQDHFGRTHVSRHGPRRLFQHQPDADNGGQVKYLIGLFNQLADALPIADRIDENLKLRMVANALQVVHGDGGQVVEHEHAPAPGEKGLDEMAPDESRTAGDQASLHAAARSPW